MNVNSKATATGRKCGANPLLCRAEIAESWLGFGQRALFASLLWAATLLLAGCQHSAPQVNPAEVVGPKLSTKSIVYVAVPSDAFYKKELAIESGRQTAELVRNNFAKYVRRAFVGRSVETFGEALETARKFNCTYLVYPWVLQWEDHATEFSGVRDKVEIKLEVADVPSGNILHSTIIKGTGQWLTSGGESPRDILPEPVAKYVATLFQVMHTPTSMPGEAP
jgi:hypothetical protein